MENLIKYANWSYKRRSFISEWATFIILTLFAKLCAMAFSIFAGFFFFYDVYSNLFNNRLLASGLSITNLLLIESLTAILVSKFFKFILHKEYKTAFFNLFLALVVFTMTFVSSTEGLALRQGKKADQTQIIKNQFKAKELALKLEYTKDCDQIQKQIQINLLNPLGWKGAKQDRLVGSQLAKIDQYYKDLKALAETYKTDKNRLTVELKNQLDINDHMVKKTSNKYYNIVVFVMLIVFFINGVLVYFFSRIQKGSNDIDNILNEVDRKTSQLVENRILKAVDKYFKEPEKPIEVAQQGNACKHCGKPFEKRGTHQKFCSIVCRDQFWNVKKS